MKSNILASAFLIVVLSISYSCNVQRRVEKQQKIFDNIGRMWLKLHPCANDSFTIYVPGKRDSIPIEIPVIILDSNYTQKQLDSLRREMQKIYTQPTEYCTEEMSRAYNLGYNAATQKWKNKLGQIKIPVPIIDTLKITLKDKQAIQLLQDDLSTSRNEVNKLNVDLLNCASKKDKWFFWFVITFIIFTISAYFNLKKL
jgi:hypothetical protein